MVNHRSTSHIAPRPFKLKPMPICANSAGSVTENLLPDVPTGQLTARSVVRSALILAGLATGGFFAGTSLLASALIVRAVTGTGSGALTNIALASGTFAGACFGSWVSQPLVTRFVVSRLRHR